MLARALLSIRPAVMSQRTIATEAAASALAAADDVQRSLMEEACILVDADDCEQRPASKLDCALPAQRAQCATRSFHACTRARADPAAAPSAPRQAIFGRTLRRTACFTEPSRSFCSTPRAA